MPAALNPIVEKIMVIALTALILLTFVGRNILVGRRNAASVIGSGAREASVLSTLLFTIVNLSVLSNRVYTLMIPIGVISIWWVKIIGYALFFCATVCCIAFSCMLKQSWRVGIVESERTELVTSGIYRRIRNPYFDSYFLIYISFALIRPSVAMVLLMLLTIHAFHRMVLREEAYLQKAHGKAYLRYKSSSGRYLPARHIRKKSSL